MTSWSLTFPEFNRSNKTNCLTAYQREQDITSPFQAKQSSSSSPKSRLECPPPLIRWCTPEYDISKKSIIDNNTFMSPRNPTSHPLVPPLHHFLQDFSPWLLSKYRGCWQTNFFPGAVSELQSLQESHVAAATQKLNQDVVKYPTTTLIHERSSQFFDEREKRSRMHNMIAPYKNKVLKIGEQKQTIDLQYRHNRIKNDLTRSLEHFGPSCLADGFMKDVPLPGNLQKNEYFIRKCTNENIKNVVPSSTTTTYHSGEDDCITSSLDKNDEYPLPCETISDKNIANYRAISFINNRIGVDPHVYPRPWETISDKNIANHRAISFFNNRIGVDPHVYPRPCETISDKNIANHRSISFINNRIGVDPHVYGINNDLTLRNLGCSSEGVYDRK